MEPLSRGIAGAINTLQGDIEALLGEKTVHQGLQLVSVHVETLEDRDDPDRGLQERLVFLGVLYPVFDGALGETYFVEILFEGHQYRVRALCREHIDKAAWNGRVIWQEEFVT